MGRGRPKKLLDVSKKNYTKEEKEAKKAEEKTLQLPSTRFLCLSNRAFGASA